MLGFPIQPPPQEQYKQENGIYIGDLDKGISQELLYITIKDFGQLAYIKLHRFPFIGVSRHFAFAYYSTEEEATFARKSLNHKIILKTPLRVTQLKAYDKDANLLFMGFKPEVTLDQVEEFFAKWGQVFSVKFSYDDQGHSRGYGWVQFDALQSSQDCLKQCQEETHLMFGESKIQVNLFVQKGRLGREDKRLNLYMKNFSKPLEFDIEDENLKKQYEQQVINDLNKIFEPFGGIGSVFVNIDKVKKVPYAFVSFLNHESAKKVVERYSPKNLESRDPFGIGQAIYINWAQRKEDRKRNYEGHINDRYIFIQYLKQDIQEDRLREVLKPFGEIQTIRFERLNFGMGFSSRIGYIVFANAADAQRLIKTTDSYQKQLSQGEQNFPPEMEKVKNLLQVFEPNFIICYLFKPTWKKYQNNRFNNQQNRRSPNRLNYIGGGGPLRGSPGPMMGQIPMPFQNPMGMGMGMDFPPMQPGQRHPFGQQQGQIPFQQQRDNGFQQNRNRGQGQFQNPRYGQGQFQHPGQVRFQQPFQQMPNQGFPQNNPNVMMQVPQAYRPPQNIPYNQRADLLELLATMNTFQAKDQQKQRDQLGVMLLTRITEKCPTLEKSKINKIVGMLIHEDFTINDILDLLRNEQELVERIQEGTDQLEQGDDN